MRLADALEAERLAADVVHEARGRLTSALNHNRSAASALDRIAEAYAGNAAFSEPGGPWTREWLAERWATYVYHAKPIPETQIEDLESALADAEEGLEAAWEVVAEARDDHRVDPKTGWVANRRRLKLAGTVYTSGDPIDPGVVEARRWSQLVDTGWVRAVR